MTICTATRGEVVGAPVRVTADIGSATVLVLRDVRPGETGQGVEPGVEYQLCLREPGVECQVCLREPGLGRQVLDRVRLGDRLVVLGTLQLDVVTEPLEDALSAARVCLDAVASGLDLGSEPS